jgi:hypothetical protein
MHPPKSKKHTLNCENGKSHSHISHKIKASSEFTGEAIQFSVYKSVSLESLYIIHWLSPKMLAFGIVYASMTLRSLNRNFEA